MYCVYEFSFKYSAIILLHGNMLNNQYESMPYTHTLNININFNAIFVD